ncbi:hypothetical protein C4J81_14330 [Deltaproteobacteria bacterium Smac51]|nr:hypothetical protein C4J81_14330 [Deltaproteobacteria bacterium Smac51]
MPAFLITRTDSFREVEWQRDGASETGFETDQAARRAKIPFFARPTEASLRKKAKVEITKTTLFSLRILLFMILTLTAVPAGAESQPIDIVSWAPTSGPSALWYEALGGLKTTAGMFNANGGVNGRPLNIISLNTDELSSDFPQNLASRLADPNVVAVVGGPVNIKAEEAADYFRSLGRPWLGPWSNEKSMYRGESSDPFAILPPWNLEMEALLGYIQKTYAASPKKEDRPIFLVYYNVPHDQAMAAEAREMASKMGLELRRAPVNLDFVDWSYLVDHVESGGAVIVWLTHGPAAAFVKAARSRMPEALFLTNSLNATNRNLVVISSGAWNGIIFPAVLKPSQEIAPAYENLFRRYGPKGLDISYQAYLGFAQGQVLARALSLDTGQSKTNLSRHLYDMKGFPTLLSAPVHYQPKMHMAPDLFYLSQAYGNGHWGPAPDPSTKSSGQ